MTAVIPDFVTLATARIQRDMARVKHPFMINRAQASVIDNYVPMPLDFVSVYQLMDQNTSNALTYITPDQSMTVQSLGWNPDQSPLPIIPPYYSPIGNQTYYTIVGNRLNQRIENQNILDPTELFKRSMQDRRDTVIASSAPKIEKIFNS